MNAALAEVDVDPVRPMDNGAGPDQGKRPGCRVVLNW